MLAAGWIDNFKVNYRCIWVLSAALLRALRVVSEHKCLWCVRHGLIIPCNDLLKRSPFNIQCIRFALNQSIDGYLPLPHAALDRQPVSR